MNTLEKILNHSQILRDSIGDETTSAGGSVGVDAGNLDKGAVTYESTNKNDSTLHREDLEKIVVKLSPNKTPIDVIVRELGGNRKCNDMKVGAREIGIRPSMDKVTDAITATTLTAANNYKLEVKVSRSNMWLPNDTFAIHLSNINSIICFIYKIEGNTLYCAVLNPADDADFSLPTIPIDTEIQRLAPAVNESTARVETLANYSKTNINYCQIFMGETDESILDEIAKKDADINFDTYSEQTTINFKRDIEAAFLFGKKSITSDSGNSNKPVYTCDGLWEQLKNGKNHNLTMSSTTSLSNDDLIDLAEDVFDNENGSETKMMFCGSGLMKELGKIQDYARQLDATTVKTVFGIKFNQIITNNGTLLIKQHNLFRGVHKYDGLVLDPAFITKEYLEPLQTKALDLDTPGIARVRAERIWETSCIFAKNIPTHLRILGTYTA
jgi:hypothetical protein